MPTYERYPGEPKARAEARIKKNLAKKKAKKEVTPTAHGFSASKYKSKKKDPKKEVAMYGRSKQGKPKRPGRRRRRVNV